MWQAPKECVDAMQKAKGELVHFSTFSSGAGKAIDAPDVVLRNGDLKLTLKLDSVSADKWHRRTFRLDVSENWIDENGSKDSKKEEFSDFLQSLTHFQIRGEYSEGNDTGKLDRVIITSR